jgi:lipoate---protein ligase
MQQLNLTLPTPEENLALDEALLDEAEGADAADEVLRLWEPSGLLVVVGRGSHVAREVDLATCKRDGVPILRRTSGGGAIVSGPGCLMYAVRLSYSLRPELRSIEFAHRHALETLAGALQRFSADVARRGISDLAMGELKFSGNSLRTRRTHLLYHGTLLYDFPLGAISRYLIEPPRQPEYRRHRAHGAFVTNLPAAKDALAQAVVDAWGAAEARETWPERRVAELVVEKYAQDGWNLRH